ncbi:sigma-70 family RNA polymerase sigma factor [Streptomyces sp. NBC_00390]|uniref:RNA polymerase sigma factor n=1 Tax=Streptomyces sp. NBC_00390 TaxID=2975736 RepID=UPI002E1CFA31
MATETEAAQARWQRAWAHREQLLKVARRRSVSLEDAEDAVHEAMLRAAENPHLDDERLGAWLTTVTMRLCVDRHRQVNRENEVRSSPRLLAPVPVPVEEAVCDRAEAMWLAHRSDELPARQAEALWLKSEDLDVGQVAVKMGLSYRTVESLLARARRTLRNSLAATLGFALWLIGRGRPQGGNAQAVAVVSTAATLAVVGLVLPHVRDVDGPSSSRPPFPAISQAAEAQSPGAGGGPPAPGSRTDTGQRSGTTGPQQSGAPGLDVPVLPGLPLPTPAVPEVATVPEGLVSGLPSLPSAPDLPAVPGGPGAAAVPDAPAGPKVPGVPAEPSASGLPSVRAPEGALPGDTPQAPAP